MRYWPRCGCPKTMEGTTGTRRCWTACSSWWGFWGLLRERLKEVEVSEMTVVR